MSACKIISPEFLLWTECLLLWGAVSYAVAADPLKEEVQRFPWRSWYWLLGLRAVLLGALSYGLNRSVVVSLFLLLIGLAQPLLRYRLPMRWVAEFECLCIAGLIIFPLAYIRHFHLASYWRPTALTDAQTGAVCLAVTTLIFIIRGGTYIVRGILRKAGTLPSRKQMAMVAEVTTLAITSNSSPEGQSAPPPNETSSSSTLTEGLSVADFQFGVDVEELNRGRLIGNLERIVLTIVVAAGSYSALAFLIAAKGLVRSEEFEKSREFTEYFLVGSLSSVLVALGAGLVLRHALLALWPELLAFQMQS
ncbi:MAG: hypothetical protein WA628_26765 [Terriglobales bacterium]